MTALNFKINNKVEIIDNEGEVHNSDIQDINGNFVAISIPIKDSTYLPLIKRDIIDILYHDENSIYSFSAFVADTTNSNIPLIWIEKPTKYKRIQRRKFVRVSVLYDGLFAPVDRTLSLNGENIKDIEFLKCKVVDFSGGGIKIRTDKELKEGDILALILPVDKKDIIVKGEVKRCGEKILNYSEYGISFIDISIRQQDEIIKHVFTVMRQQMRKGLKEE